MDIYEALYTTRAMRRVRPDPIPLEVQARMLDAAIRAPSGGNSQNWRFLLADDTDVIGRIGPLYRHSIDQLWETVYAERLAAAEADPEADESIQMLKIQRSAQWLADHFEEVPLFLFGFVQLERSIGGTGRRGGQFDHRRARFLPSQRGVGDSRCAHRRGLGDGLLCELRLSDRTLGYRPPSTGRRGVLPQSMGLAGRPRHRPTPLASLGVTTGGSSESRVISTGVVSGASAGVPCFRTRFCAGVAQW
jgi:hypothetical protein